MSIIYILQFFFHKICILQQSQYLEVILLRFFHYLDFALVQVHIFIRIYVFLRSLSDVVEVNI